MPGKVVRTELVRRVLSILCQVVGPLAQDVPILIHILCVSIYLGEHGCQGEHVTRFLQRHVAPVCLSVGYRIGSQVVCSKRLGPPTAPAVLEDGGHHGFLQVRIIDQEERSLRIGQVHRVYAAIGVVLLGEEEQVAILVLEEFVGSYHVPV